MVLWHDIRPPKTAACESCWGANSTQASRLCYVGLRQPSPRYRASGSWFYGTTSGRQKLPRARAAGERTQHRRAACATSVCVSPHRDTVPAGHGSMARHPVAKNCRARELPGERTQHRRAACATSVCVSPHRDTVPAGHGSMARHPVAKNCRARELPGSELNTGEPPVLRRFASALTEIPCQRVMVLWHDIRLLRTAARENCLGANSTQASRLCYVGSPSPARCDVTAPKSQSMMTCGARCLRRLAQSPVFRKDPARPCCAAWSALRPSPCPTFVSNGWPPC